MRKQYRVQRGCTIICVRSSRALAEKKLAEDFGFEFVPLNGALARRTFKRSKSN